MSKSNFLKENVELNEQILDILNEKNDEVFKFINEIYNKAFFDMGSFAKSLKSPMTQLELYYFHINITKALVSQLIIHTFEFYIHLLKPGKKGSDMIPPYLDEIKTVILRTYEALEEENEL